MLLSVSTYLVMAIPERDVRTKLDNYFLLYINVIGKMSTDIFLLELEGTQSEGFE